MGSANGFIDANGDGTKLPTPETKRGNIFLKHPSSNLSMTENGIKYD